MLMLDYLDQQVVAKDFQCLRNPINDLDEERRDQQTPRGSLRRPLASLGKLGRRTKKLFGKGANIEPEAEGEIFMGSSPFGGSEVEEGAGIGMLHRGFSKDGGGESVI